MKFALPAVSPADRAKYQYYTDGSIQGVLLINSLPKRLVMRAMRGTKNNVFKAIMEAMGADTNPNWIIGQCVERAYYEGWIDEAEFSKRRV